MVTHHICRNTGKEMTEVISDIQWISSSNSVSVQRREAGFAELDVTVTSPLGQDLPLEVKSYGNERDCDLIEFCPSLPGNYRFKMTYGGEEISGIIMKRVVSPTLVREMAGSLNTLVTTYETVRYDHGVILQKTVIFIKNIVKTSNHRLIGCLLHLW